ncbi:unnamed protein product [Lactuca saligna]|uniref:Beta-carotene isomerase D27-like C-terminal domain-containing protein n=1 Tax=Lactuca saligna TaxID=75948 RepID=A0AA35ZWR1_LACSI|nr:unnamed protein product [Lactuca saligna]
MATLLQFQFQFQFHSICENSLRKLKRKPQFRRSANHGLFRVSAGESGIQKTTEALVVSRSPGVLDHVFLNLFRNKMVQEVGWDSEKAGYDGLIDVANRLMLARTNSQTQEAAVRILRSLFPPLLLKLYKILIAPLAQGKVAAVMVARVTAVSCEWLMGSCRVNTVDLGDGSSLPSGVFVERCKYLEESKCVGICLNTCKLPTQAFFMDHMGVPLVMEPNFDDYSCQFKFGVSPPEEDSSLKEPCLEVCPNAIRRRTTTTLENKCPKA